MVVKWANDSESVRILCLAMSSNFELKKSWQL